MMITRSYVTLLIILTLTLMSFAALAQQNARELFLGVSEGSDVKATLDTAQVVKKSAEEEKEGWKITDVQMSYAPYTKRMVKLLSYAEAQDSVQKQKEKDETAARDSLEQEIKILKAKMTATQKKIDAFPDRITPSAEEKALWTEKTALKKQIYTLDKELGRRYLDTMKAGGNYMELLDQIDTLKALKQVKPLDEKNARPLIEKIEFSDSDENGFRAELKVNKETLAAFDREIERVGNNIKYLTKDLEEAKKYPDQFNEEVRKPLIDDATKAHKEFLQAYETFINDIDTEMWSRATAQFAADVAEVFIEGKGPPGWILETGAKIAEAIVVNKMGTAGYSMFDSSELLKEYTQKNRQMTMHWDNNTIKAGVLWDQTLRSGINVTEDLAAQAVTQNIKRKFMQEALNEMLNDAMTNPFKYANDAIGKQVALRAGERALDKLQKDLLTVDITYWLRTPGSGYKGPAITAAETLTKEAKEKAIKNMIELTKHTNKSARIAMQKATAEGLVELNKHLTSFDLKNFIKNPADLLEAGAGKKIATGLGRGLAWDGLRLGLQAMIDKYAQEYWIDFLEADIKVRGFHTNLRTANSRWKDLSRMAMALEIRRNAAKLSLNHVKAQRQKYIAGHSASNGLHVAYSAPLKGDEGYGAYIVLHERGALQGHKVILSGDKGRQVLVSDSNQVENWAPNDARLKRETDFSDFLRKTKYKVPSTVALHQLSSNGDLKLEIIVQ